MSYPRNRAANTCQIAILQVGGVEPPEIAIPRCEYIIAGQIFEIHASNLACACIWDLGGAVALSFSLCRVLSAGPCRGAPLEQISIAEPLAKNGETCLSPQAWEHVQNYVAWPGLFVMIVMASQKTE